MPTSESKKRADAKYIKEAFDDVRVRVRKGRRDELKALAIYSPTMLIEGGAEDDS